MAIVKQHVLCQCGHGAMIHTNKCWVKGCSCTQYRPDPKQTYDQEDHLGEEDRRDSEERAAIERREYSSFAAIIADGWVVD